MQKKIVYISHPYGNSKENLLDIEKIISHLYICDEIFEKFVIVSATHTFGFMYETYAKIDYFKSLSFCLDLLAHSDIMIMVGDWESSVGCTQEKEFCDKNNIPYIYYETSDKLINQGYSKIISKLTSKLGLGD